MKKLLSILSTNALLFGSISAVANTNPKTLQANEAKTKINIDKSVANWHIQTKPLDFVIKGKRINNQVTWEKDAGDIYKEIFTEVREKFSNIEPNNYPTDRDHKKVDLGLNLAIKNLSPAEISVTMNQGKPTLKSYELDWSNSSKTKYNLYPKRKYVNLIYQIEDEQENRLKATAGYENFLYFLDGKLKNIGYALKTANDFNSISYYDFEYRQEIKSSEELRHRIAAIIRTEAKALLRDGFVDDFDFGNLLKSLEGIRDSVLLPNFINIAENNINNLRNTGKNGYINNSWLNFKFQIQFPPIDGSNRQAIQLNDFVDKTMHINLDAHHDIDRTASLNPYRDDFSPFLRKLNHQDYRRDLESKSILNSKYVEANIGQAYKKYYNNEDFNKLIENLENQLRYTALNKSKHEFHSLRTNHTFSSYSELNEEIKFKTDNKVDFDLLIDDIAKSSDLTNARMFRDEIFLMYNILSTFMPYEVLFKLISKLELTDNDVNGRDIRVVIDKSNTRLGPWNIETGLSITKGALSKKDYYLKAYHDGLSVSHKPWYGFFHHFGTLLSAILGQEKALKSDPKEVQSAIELNTINYPMYQLQNEIYKHFSPITNVDGFTKEDLPVDGFSYLYSWLVVDSAWGRTYDKRALWFGEAFAKWLLADDFARDKSWEVLHESFIRTLTNYLA